MVYLTKMNKQMKKNKESNYSRSKYLIVIQVVKKGFDIWIFCYHENYNILYLKFGTKVNLNIIQQSLKSTDFLKDFNINL